MYDMIWCSKCARCTNALQIMRHHRPDLKCQLGFTLRKSGYCKGFDGSVIMQQRLFYPCYICDQPTKCYHTKLKQHICNKCYKEEK